MERFPTLVCIRRKSWTVTNCVAGWLVLMSLASAAFSQTGGNAGLPLELKLSTPTYVVRGPDVFEQIPIERGVIRVSGPGILRITWLVKKDFDDMFAKGGFALSWQGQGQTTLPGRVVGQSQEPEKAQPGKPLKFVWLCAIPPETKDLAINVSLSAFWQPQMDQNPWAGIDIYSSQQTFLIDWLESTALGNVSGTWSGTTSTGFGLDLNLQERNNTLQGTLNGNPITGKRLADGSLEFVSTNPRQNYRGIINPETGSIKGTFDCEESKLTNVAWEAKRGGFERNPILEGGVTELPKEPTHFPSGQLTVRAGSRKVNAGETVLVPVTIEGGKGVGNLSVVIEYNSQVGQVRTASRPGEILAGRLFESNAQEPGVFRFGLAGKEGLTRDGILTLIPITAIGQPGEKSPLKVIVTAANADAGEQLESAVVAGEIEIVSAGGAGSGDVNGDGKVDSLDALAALKMSVKLLAENMAADMDHDGTVTSNDARLIMLKYVGR